MEFREYLFEQDLEESIFSSVFSFLKPKPKDDIVRLLKSAERLIDASGTKDFKALFSTLSQAVGLYHTADLKRFKVISDGILGILKEYGLLFLFLKFVKTDNPSLYKKILSSSSLKLNEADIGLNQQEPNLVYSTDTEDEEEDEEEDDPFALYTDDEDLEIIDSEDPDEEDEDEEDEDDLEDDDLEESYEYVTETVKKKKVIRNGKRVIKWVSNRKGYKIVRDGNRAREVRMSAQEIRQRKIQQRKAARKRKAKKGISQRKRQLSLRRRSSMGIK